MWGGRPCDRAARSAAPRDLRAHKGGKGQPSMYGPLNAPGQTERTLTGVERLEAYRAINAEKRAGVGVGPTLNLGALTSDRAVGLRSPKCMRA